MKKKCLNGLPILFLEIWVRMISRKYLILMKNILSRLKEWLFFVRILQKLLLQCLELDWWLIQESKKKIDMIIKETLSISKQYLFQDPQLIKERAELEELKLENVCDSTQMNSSFSLIKRHKFSDIILILWFCGSLNWNRTLTHFPL